MDRRMKPGRRQAMNKIKKMYKHDRTAILNWFMDGWPLLEEQLMDLVEDRINGWSKQDFKRSEQYINGTFKEFNLDKPDNVIQFRKKA